MVPHNVFPLIGSSGQAVSNQFGPHRQMVSMDKWSPTNLVPLDKWSVGYSVGIQKFKEWIGSGSFVQVDRTKFVGDHLSRGSILWGSFVQGDRKKGDQIGDQMCAALKVDSNAYLLKSIKQYFAQSSPVTIFFVFLSIQRIKAFI